MNTENQWGENHVPLRMNEVKINWLQNCMFPFILSQIYSIFPVTLLCLPALTPQRREGERDSVPYSWEGQQKALGWLEKEGILYRPRGSESQSLQHFFPSIFMWALHSFWVSSYCILHGPKTVSVQRFAPVKGCLGRLAAPINLSPPARQRCSEG